MTLNVGRGKGKWKVPNKFTVLHLQPNLNQIVHLLISEPHLCDSPNHWMVWTPSVSRLDSQWLLHGLFSRETDLELEHKNTLEINEINLLLTSE